MSPCFLVASEGYSKSAFYVCCVVLYTPSSSSSSAWLQSIDLEWLAYRSVADLPHVDLPIEFVVSLLSLAGGRKGCREASSWRLRLAKCRWHVTAWLSSNLDVPSMSSFLHLASTRMMRVPLCGLSLRLRASQWMQICDSLWYDRRVQRPRNRLHDGLKGGSCLTRDGYMYISCPALLVTTNWRTS